MIVSSWLIDETGVRRIAKPRLADPHLIANRRAWSEQRRRVYWRRWKQQARAQQRAA